MSTILHERIREQLEKKGMSARAASLAAGAKETLVRDFLRNPNASLRTENLTALAKVLETTPQYLLGDTFTATTPVQRRTLPVLGRAAAAVIGAQNILTEAIEFSPVPPGLEGVRDAYCLWVEGDSMAPLYRPRDPIFIHPRQPVSKGDIVVIQEERDGSVYASVKEFIRKDDTHIHAAQYNPRAVLKFPLSRVLFVHRVLPLREVLNL